MSTERSEAREHISVTMQAQAGMDEHTHVTDHVTVECYSADGRLLWREETAPAIDDVINDPEGGTHVA
jgi:hypothetical protein